MRKSIRAKPTEKAIDLLIAKLDQLRGQGNDPNKVIEQSIENNYKGLFPLKTGGNGNGRRTPDGKGGPGIQYKEFAGTVIPEIPEAERQRNLAKLREITGG